MAVENLGGDITVGDHSFFEPLENSIIYIYA